MAIHIKPEIKALKESIISTRRDIHQHPELAFDEHRTAQLVADRLHSLEWTYKPVWVKPV